MKRLVTATLLTLAAIPTYLLFAQPASADNKKVTVCHPVQQVRVVKDDADHPAAYRDGYREGQRSVRKGDAYKPRTVGGEFSRGFEDGYYDRPFEGQRYEVADRLETYTTQQCDTYTVERRR